MLFSAMNYVKSDFISRLVDGSNVSGIFWRGTITNLIYS